MPDIDSFREKLYSLISKFEKAIHDSLILVDRMLEMYKKKNSLPLLAERKKLNVKSLSQLKR